MLDKIITHKRQMLSQLDLAKLTADAKASATQMPPVRSLWKSLTASSEISIIAEIKRRSPSKGDLNINLDPVRMATIYQEAGAVAISVLTEENFFGGSVDDLTQARASVDIPILRKDFILDEYQIWDSRKIGADAILLIAAILTDDELKKLYDIAMIAGLEVLLEVHSESELERALLLDPKIIGINNRNLDNFTVSLQTTADLAKMIGDEIAIISESGIHNSADMIFVQKHGVSAALVGESIVTSNDPAQQIRNLLERREAIR